jgi:hypothetical protein
MKANVQPASSRYPLAGCMDQRAGLDTEEGRNILLLLGIKCTFPCHPPTAYLGGSGTTFMLKTRQATYLK